MLTIGLPEWHLFPCQPNAKTPATLHGLYDAVRNPDPATLQGFNVGLRTGKCSGVFTLDVDVNDGKVGALTLETLEHAHGRLPATLRFQTWSGGLHYVFRYPLDGPVPSRVGFQQDLDIRSDGAYALIPPSIIHDRPYVWMDAEAPSDALILEAPAWLLALIRALPTAKKFVFPFDAEGLIPQGQQDDTMIRFACSLRAQGFDEAAILAAIREALTKCRQDPARPFTEKDTARWLASSARYDQGKGRAKAAENAAKKAVERSKKAEVQAAAARQKAERISLLEAKGLIYNKQTGTLTSAQMNVVALLSLKYAGQFWRNEFSMRDYCGRAEVTDELINRLHTELETDQRIVFRRDHLEHGLADLCASDKRNPLRDWLAGLAWDQETRLDRLAVEVFKAENPLATVLVRKWLLSAVARVFEPGCKVDHMLLLIGKQGIYKSTSLRILASDEYFLDHIEDLRDKDTLVKFKSRWICEFQELSALRRSEIEHIKAFITRQSDIYRVPYGHRDGVSPRTCVFAATTNDDHPLKEEDENRRFWPVYCRDGEQIELERLRDWREQLWAEAVEAYRSGEALYVQDALLLDELTSQQRELSAPLSDPWEDALQSVLTQEWLFLGDAFDKLDLPADRQTMLDTMRLTRILRRNGFVRGPQIGGGPHRGKRAWLRKSLKGTTPWFNESERPVEF